MTTHVFPPFVMVYFKLPFIYKRVYSNDTGYLDMWVVIDTVLFIKTGTRGETQPPGNCGPYCFTGSNLYFSPQC